MKKTAGQALQEDLKRNNVVLDMGFDKKSVTYYIIEILLALFTIIFLNTLFMWICLVLLFAVFSMHRWHARSLVVKNFEKLQNLK